MAQPRSDQDSPWKEILRQYFQQAIVFFFPETAALIDWSRPHEFLDKEFQQIALESEIGKRYADQLVKVWLKDGKELWLLLHLEVQARAERNFSERMFVYNFRIFEYFHRPAISLAILCDNSKTWRPHEYTFSYPGTRLSFEFDTVKLLDYAQRWDELEVSRNPFAVVVMAHLKAQETVRDPQARKEYKFSLIRRLYEQGYERQAVVNLFRFVDWVMILPEGLKQAFWRELKLYEEERSVPYITSVEEIGFERGIVQGLQQGERSLILKQLSRRVGAIPEAAKTKVEALSVDQLELLGEALLDFAAIADLFHWLDTH
jgi:hypothetical protein